MPAAQKRKSAGEGRPVKESPTKKTVICADCRDLEGDTIANDSYRKVVYTVPKQFQLVLMSLDEGENIPREIHPKTVQFIRVERGTARITVGDKVFTLSDGSSITIPPNNYHLVENTTKARLKAARKLKLYTIYTPPEHPPTRHQRRQPKL